MQTSNAPKGKVKKNLSIPVGLANAVELFIALNQGKTGAGAKDFSHAVTLGLRKLLNANHTSEAKLLKQLKGAR
jgi:hypothetical protein